MILRGSLRNCSDARKNRGLLRVSMITIGATIAAFLMVFVWTSFDPNITPHEAYLGGLIIPLIIAPFASFVTLRLQIRVEELADENYKLANIDSLTGLPNRRAFMRRTEALQALADADRIFVCMIGDADDFKQVNDTYGHPVGDDVLAFLGNQLLALEIDDGVVARLGGEEFAVGGLFGSLEEARTYGETLVGSIARQVFVGRGLKLSVTISVGMAVDRGGESMSALLSRADRALYAAKHDGKNRLSEAA